MQPTKLEDRPPFVTFATVSVEDREATLKAGHYVGRDVDYAYITPAGSKDRIERVVSEWFDKLRDDLVQERVPAAWVDAYKQAYAAFKEGKEIPTKGFPVIDWPGLSPSLVKTLLSLHLRAVEDVACANEETIARIGMGARALKQRAIDFLATAEDIGKVAEQASATKVQNDTLLGQNAALVEQVRQLSAQVAALAGARNPAQAPHSDTISGDDLGLTKL